MPSMIWNNMFNNMAGIMALLAGFLFLLGGCSNQAMANGSKERAEERKLLIVYSTKDGEMNETVRILDLALGHFSAAIVVKSDESLSDSDLRGITHLIYLGEWKKEIPDKSKQIIMSYPGPLLVIGENIEQFSKRYAFDAEPKKSWINKVSKPGSSSYERLIYQYPVTEVTWANAKPVLAGWRGDYPIPLFIMKEDSAYFATAQLDYVSLYFLSEGLHTFFQEQHAPEHLAYIRLEDVHPFSDPALVKQTGEYLADQGIPFMIALIPVYTNPQTREQHHLQDVPELVEVLKGLQQRGASIILHGYTHQYRARETGEGFEFWDVENNIPISGPPEAKIEVMQRHDFATKEEYDAYRSDLTLFDHNYTKTRIESGIRELTSLGLHPLGFEPPHYTMSQEGYRTVSEYFPYLIGQVQVSDQNWEHLLSAPYATRPSFLHGMTLLPETAGYYDPASLTPLEDVKEKIRNVQFVHDGMIGMFYHPYLGLEHLKEMIALTQTVPNLKWLDLKKLEHDERTKFAAVDCRDKPCAGSNEEKSASQTIISQILWSIAGIVTLAVTAFILYTVWIRMGLRKQLFEERVTGGQ